MNLNFNSFYLSLANKTLNWLPMDTLELYNQNLKNKYDILEKNNWIGKTLEYKFNSHGFRCEGIDNSPSIIFVGCSYTIGIGLAIEDTFSSHVSRKLNLKNINLGIGGSSTNTAFRLGSYWVQRLKPKIIFYLEPNDKRLEVLHNEKIVNLLPNNHKSIIDSTITKFYETVWLMDDNNYYLNAMKNRLALKQICQENGTKFVCSNLEHIIPHLDLARDLSHRGIKSHIAAAEKILNLIDSE